MKEHKKQFQANYQYLSNYCFSLSLGVWSLPGGAILQSFLTGSSFQEMIRINPERLPIFIFSFSLALGFGGLGFTLSSVKKQL